MGRWTALALLGMLALLVSGSAGAAPWDVDENLSWSGYFKNETAYRYREPRSFTKIRNMLALEANYRFTDRIDLTAAGWAYYDLVYDLFDYRTVSGRAERDI